MKLNKHILTIGFLGLMLYYTPFIAQNSRFDIIQKKVNKTTEGFVTKRKRGNESKS